MHLGEVIKEYRLEKELSMQAFADKCGVSKGYIAMLERNINSKTGEPVIPSIETFIKVAKAMNIPLSELIDQVDENQPVNLVASKELSSINYDKYGIQQTEIRTLPLIGSAACGEPIIAVQEYEFASVKGATNGVTHLIKAKGDSMINAGINDGDLIFIRQQPTVENGQVALVLIGEEALLKRFYFNEKNQTVTLVSENPSYAPMVFSGPDAADVHIFGRAIIKQGPVK